MDFDEKAGVKNQEKPEGANQDLKQDRNIEIALTKQGRQSSTEDSTPISVLKVAKANLPGLVMQANPRTQGADAGDAGSPSQPGSMLLGKNDSVTSAPMGLDSRSPGWSQVASQ